ncbi:uncharacterized protein LOC126901463 [Daktulosphaira vitifoliae]|uniref:uncharacterized protein LOC126901463 n=1 Tax=Daktulosphaira vitifoliae TaxID=58002 RepID=UPI0021AAC914|nr:uncharacterized protein LOC126901463 [Daktulosphaira vitifoliae]
MTTKFFIVYCVIGFLFVMCVFGLKKDKFYCEMASPCICVSANNDKVDLSNITVPLNLTNNVTLIYQPCPDEEQNPNIYAVSIENSTSNETLQLAPYMDSSFVIGDFISLIYKNSSSNVFQVNLSCNESATNGNEYLTDFKNYTNNYIITLKTSEVCGLNLIDAIENDSTSSLSIFFSLLLFIVFVYLIGGSVINACLLNKTGVNIIPHHEFWSSIYNNLKEKMCGSAMMASAYESI